MQLNTPAPTQRPTETFTGEVLMTPLATGVQPSRLGVGLVRFTPGARTFWHVHPLGQVLHVTDGTALVGTRDGSVVRARAGDTVVCAPGEEHWHGATADAFAAHLAIQEGPPSVRRARRAPSGGSSPFPTRCTPRPSTSRRRTGDELIRRAAACRHLPRGCRWVGR